MTTDTVKHDVRDLRLAEEGVRRIEWAAREMPVLRQIRERFAKEKPLNGMRMAACLHVTTETANLSSRCATAAPTSRSAPRTRSPRRTTSPPRSSPSTASPTFAIKGEDNDTYYRHIDAALDHKPQITMDDGADLVARAAQGPHATCSPTSSAAPRRRPPASSACARMAAEGMLEYPIIAVNEAEHQALLRQPLRHRPEHARRHHPRDQHPAGRQDRRRRAATAGAAAASPAARAAWARRSSSPRSTRCRRSKR